MSSNGNGFGLDYWGVGPWGILPASPAFELESVFANSERTARVTLTRSALLGTPFRTGAALNLSTWALSIVGDTTPLILAAVREVEGSDARQFELFTLRKFPAYPKLLELTVNGLLASDLAPLTGSASAEFEGAALPQVTPRANASVVADLRSKLLPGEYVGTMTTTASGDYETESGDALLRKMILRRLITVRGAFQHLPNFGLGLRSKSLLRGGGINDLRVAIESEIAREPDVGSVRAKLTYRETQAILIVDLHVVRVSTNETVPISQTFPVGD